jgi:phosphoribosylglycinamide formyltransferase-1
MTEIFKEKKHIAIFASGTGSNAQKIIDYFSIVSPLERDNLIEVVLIVCNNTDAGVLKIAEKENIPSIIIQRRKFYDDGYLPELKNFPIDLIVLAGFMWKIPPVLIQAYQHKIINIHPALLPKFGGKGMYGNVVHEAVLKAKVKESGITIHFVDEIYDNGKIILQAKCKVDENDTLQSLSEKIHGLEHSHYASVIEKILLTQ